MLCGLGPDAIWDLTPHQMTLFFDGANRKAKQQRELEAWKLSHSMSMWSKKPITMGQILGRRSVSAADYGSVDAFRAAVAAAKQEGGDS